MTRLLAVIVAATMMSGVAEAQARTEPAKAKPPVQPTTGRPRVGYAASPPPEQPRPAQPQYAPPIYYEQGYGVIAAPFVVLADGSILANFGNGYERVLRACAAPQGATQADVSGRDALGRILPPPGIAAFQQGSRGQVYGQLPERNVGACYRMDAQGRAEVVRY